MGRRPLGGNIANVAAPYLLLNCSSDKTLNNQALPYHTPVTLNHLAAILVTGDECPKFLQGQLTCDVYSLQTLQPSLAAFCTAKGRVISTLLVVKTANGFVLIMPNSLRDKVLNKLRMYILRAKVQLSTDIQIIGLHQDVTKAHCRTLHQSAQVFALPWTTDRQLCALPSTIDPATQADDSAYWLYLDIGAGIPWFEYAQSELYTPQMLNIDGLGGISFTKGCYTGQEIVARTHYLGKAKRHLIIAEYSNTANLLEAGTAILDAQSLQTLGSVLISQNHQETIKLLGILQHTDDTLPELVLDDSHKTPIRLAQ